MADYLLVFDPVEGRVAYLKLSPLWLEEGEPAALGRVVFSSFDLPSGAARVRELSRRWYRLDAKLLASLAPRYAAERYAPLYEVRLPVPCGATVDVLWGYLTVAWGVPVEERAPRGGEPGLLRVVPLFRNVEDVREFLEGQAVFARMVAALATARALRAGEVAAAVAEVFERAAELAASYVSRVPGSLELVERVLAKFNVTYRDVVDFAASEEVARRLIARLREMLAQQAGAGGGGGA